MPSLIAGEPLRMLLVSPDEFRRVEVGAALAAAGDHRFYWVSQPDLALTRAQDLAPHVILIDDAVEAGGARIGSLVQRLVQGLPQSVVLLLAEPGALAVAQAAVAAGARAFVLKPVNDEDLVSALRQALARQATASPLAHEGPRCHVVVFCAPKGGTGRTTLAINTAVSLADMSHEPIVIVDADYAAPALDVALNLKGGRDIRDLLPKLQQLDADLIASVLRPHPFAR